MSAFNELKLKYRLGEPLMPADVMRRYAEEHSGAEFDYSQFGVPVLRIEGAVYYYPERWAVKKESDGIEYVTLFLEKGPKELFNYHFVCDCWKGVCREEISVLAESFNEACDKAIAEANRLTGSPEDEVSLVSYKCKRADLGLLLYQSVKAYRAYAKVAEYLEMGADVNYRFCPDEFNYAPLHMAAYFGDMKIIKMLVKAGCDMNPLDIKNCTPLDHAIARHNDPEVVDYLVAHGAKRGLDVVLDNARERSAEIGNKIAEREMDSLALR